ncbi:kelch repeat-containing protein [Chloroflexota bacterium]
MLLFNGYDTKVGGSGYVRLDEESKARDEWAYDVAQNRMEFLRTAPYTVHTKTAYDEQSCRLVGFGADDTAVYALENKAWQKTEPEEQPGTWRVGFGLAYDSQSDRTILFGGNPHGSLLNDTWAYDYETNTWTEMSPDVSPSRRDGHAMAYDT